MAETIKLAYEFDFVHDGQKVFRKLLDALANPGTKSCIQKEAEKFKGRHKTLLALGCTLLDNEEKMYVEKNTALAKELHSLTLSREAELEEADYIFLSSEMNYGSMEQILRNVKHGTYADPQESATLFLLCDAVSGDLRITIKGPGVPGEREVSVSSYVGKVIEIRNQLKTEYPLGVDLVFTDRTGVLMGIPRLIKLEKTEEKRG